MTIVSPDMGSIHPEHNLPDIFSKSYEQIAQQTKQELSQLGEPALIVSIDGNTIPKLATRAPEYDETFGAEVYKVPDEHNKLYIKGNDGILYPITLVMSERLIKKLFDPEITKEQFDKMIDGYVEVGFYIYLYDLLDKEAQNVLAEIGLDENTLAKFIASIPPEKIKKLVELIEAPNVLKEDGWQRIAVGLVLWEAGKYQNPSDSLTKLSELALTLFDPNYNGRLATYSLVGQLKELFKIPEKDLLDEYAQKWDELFADSGIKGQDLFNASLISKLGVNIGKNVYYIKYWLQEAQNRGVSKEIENLLFKYTSLFYSSKLLQYIDKAGEDKVIQELEKLAQSGFGDLAYIMMLSTPSLADKVAPEIENQIYQTLQQGIDPQHFENFELTPQELAQLGENIKKLAKQGLLSAYLSYVFDNYDKLSQKGELAIRYLLGPKGDSLFVTDLLDKKIDPWHPKNRVISVEVNKWLSDIVLDRKNAELDRKNAELDRKNAELDRKNAELEKQLSKLAEQVIVLDFYKSPQWFIWLKQELPNYPDVFSAQSMKEFNKHLKDSDFYKAASVIFLEIGKKLGYNSLDEFIREISKNIDTKNRSNLVGEEAKTFLINEYRKALSNYNDKLSPNEKEFIVTLLAETVTPQVFLYTLQFLQTNYPQLAQIWGAVIASYDTLPFNPKRIIADLNAKVNDILKNPQNYPPKVVEIAQKLTYPELTSPN